ncbi:MAG: hypothetical protein JNG88_17010 [Phycisphaerales bacterium]|nr:hypothetical protein [Phycisphaerales bacterium]
MTVPLGHSMETKHVDLTQSIYADSGSNLAFDSKVMVWEYLTKKWGE